MSWCAPAGAVPAMGRVTAECPSTSVASSDGGTLLPDPTDAEGIASLYALFSASNREDAESEKIGAEVTSAAKRASMRDRAEALERARKAQEEQSGIFDSLGIASLVGVATANPLVAMVDMTMHMARLTPECVRELEKEHQDAVEVAVRVYCAAVNASALADGRMNTECLRAAVALGGLLVQETELFGREQSSWVGNAMVIGHGVDARAAAAVVIADKDSAIAGQIREVEIETRSWNKYIAVAGMAVAAAAAIVASWGTATAPVVLVGVALSASGFLVTETKCLDPMLGKDASMWTGVGMTVAGALITGAGSTAGCAELASRSTDLASKGVQGARAAAKALETGGKIVEGVTQSRQGLTQVANAATRYEIDQANDCAQQRLYETQRIERNIEDILDSVRELGRRHRRLSEAVSEAVETQCQTQLMAAGVRV